MLIRELKQNKRITIALNVANFLPNEISFWIRNVMQIAIIHTFCQRFIRNMPLIAITLICYVTFIIVLF